MGRRQGYIKVFRSVQDCWIWNGEKYDKAHAWMDLLLEANHSDVKLMIDGKPTVIERGSIYTSKLALAKRWRWDRKTVTNFLSILEADNMVSQTTSKNGTTITIVNYGVYQQSEDNETDNRTDNRTDTRTDTNKNVKNVKKINIEKENIKEKELIKEKFDLSDEFVSAVELWLEYKKERKQSYKSDTSLATMVKHLIEYSDGDASVAMRIVERSMANNWAGLFPLDTKQADNAKETELEIDYSKSAMQRNVEQWQ